MGKLIRVCFTSVDINALRGAVLLIDDKIANDHSLTTEAVRELNDLAAELEARIQVSSARA